MNRIGYKIAAERQLAAAIKSGLLLKASNHACVDCGKPATGYDHRDYSKPLDVVPVCQSCNCKRGPGLPWPDNIIRDENYSRELHRAAAGAIAKYGSPIAAATALGISNSDALYRTSIGRRKYIYDDVAAKLGLTTQWRRLSA